MPEPTMKPPIHREGGERLSQTNGVNECRSGAGNRGSPSDTRHAMPDAAKPTRGRPPRQDGCTQSLQGLPATPPSLPTIKEWTTKLHTWASWGTAPSPVTKLVPRDGTSVTVRPQHERRRTRHHPCGSPGATPMLAVSHVLRKPSGQGS